jgi:hypothetical protein
MLERDDLSMARSQPKLFQSGLGMCDGEGRERRDPNNARGPGSGFYTSAFILSTHS